MDKRRRVPVKEAICVIEKSMEKTLRPQKLMSICVFFQPFLITLRFDRNLLLFSFFLHIYHHNQREANRKGKDKSILGLRKCWLWVVYD